MRYPHYNFKTEYNTTAGYFYGDKTSYGYHEGIDVNDNLGGDSDLGKPIIAMRDGEVTSVHSHTGKPTFGNHLHYKIEGPWGTHYVHHAHCQEILVQIGEQIKEGQLIAYIGKSGTDWAHDHWAIKKQPTGIDAIAHNLEELKMWENPIDFVEKYSEIIANPIANPVTDQTIIDLGQYGKHEVQALRGFYGDALNWKKDLENAGKEIESFKIEIDKLKKEIEIQGEIYNSLLRAYNALKSGADADSNHLPPPGPIINFPPIISKFINWLKKWFR